MDFVMVLRYLAVAVTLFTGVYSLLAPKRINGFTGLEATSPRAITEIRAVMGGTFIGLSVAALIFPIKEVFMTLGIAYLAIAIIRAVSMFVDRSLVKSNWISLASEIVLIVCLFL